jgi:hypothetical protein
MEDDCMTDLSICTPVVAHGDSDQNNHNTIGEHFHLDEMLSQDENCMHVGVSDEKRFF